MAKVYGYIRASTSSQVLTPEVQREQIMKFFDFKLQGHVLAEIFEDQATSGSIPLADRIAGRKLSAALEPGDIVIISKLDRGFRSMRDIVNTLHAWDARGIRLCLLDVNCDTSTLTGRMLIYLVGMFAEFERERISERTREALNARKTLGAPDNGKAPWGMKWHGAVKGRRRLIRDSRTRTIGGRIVNMRMAGHQWKEIIKEMWRRYQESFTLPRIMEWYRNELAAQGQSGGGDAT